MKNSNQRNNNNNTNNNNMSPTSTQSGTDVPVVDIRPLPSVQTCK